MVIPVHGKWTRIDGEPASGYVIISASNNIIATGTSVVMMQDAITEILDANGEISLDLVATDDPTYVGSPFYYHIIVALYGTEPYHFNVLIPMSTVGVFELATATPLNSPCEGGTPIGQYVISVDGRTGVVTLTDLYASVVSVDGLDTRVTALENAPPVTGIGTLNDIGDVVITSPQSGQVLTYTNGEWINSPEVSGVSKLYVDTEIAEEASAREAADNTLQTNINNEATSRQTGDTNLDNTKVNRSGDTITGPLILDTSAGTALPLRINGNNTEALAQFFDGNNVLVAQIDTDGSFNAPNIPGTLDELTDVTITGPATEQLLTYNGTNWVNSPAPSGWGSVTSVNGQTGEVSLDAADVNAVGIVTSISSFAYGSNLSGIQSPIEFSSDPAIFKLVSRDNNSKFTVLDPTAPQEPTSKAYVDAAIAALPVPPENLPDLDDVTITTPASGQILTYSGTQWINSPAPTGGGGGAVDSVNGQTGVVVLDAADVQAVATVAANAIVYGTNESGVQSPVPYSSAPATFNLVMRDFDQTFTVLDPTAAQHPTSKTYVDAADAALQSQITALPTNTTFREWLWSHNGDAAVTTPKHRVYNETSEQLVITNFRASAEIAPTGSALTLTLNIDGVLSTTLDIPTNQTSNSVTLTTGLSIGSNVQIFISAVGSTTPGADITAQLTVRNA